MTSQDQGEQGRRAEQAAARWALSLPAREVPATARPACEQMIRQLLEQSFPGIDLGIRWGESPQIVLLELGSPTTEEEIRSALAQVSASLAMFQLTLQRMTELCPDVFDPHLLLEQEPATEDTETMRCPGPTAEGNPQEVN